MSAEERKLRENRRRNLDRVLTEEMTSRQFLAKKLGSYENYITQLRRGNRAITDSTARMIEAAVGLPHRSLDDRDIHTVSRLTDTEIEERVQVIVKDECRRHKLKPKGELFEAAIRLATVHAKERGFSEARIRLFVQELLL